MANAASLRPLSLSHDEIAPGELLSITGIHLAASGDASVRLSVKLGSIALVTVSATPTKIEARVPANAPLGAASLTVTAGGRTSRAIPVRLVRSQPGIFSRNGHGFGPGRIDNLPAAGGRVSNSMSRAAAPGQRIVVSTTGLPPGEVPALLVAGQRAVVSGTVSPDGEITVRIPPTASEGCFVPLQIRSAAGTASNIVTLAIRRSGGPCALAEAMPFAGWAGSRYGFVGVARTVEHNSSGSNLTDEAGGSFALLPDLDNLPPFFLLPPPGACASQVEAVEATDTFGGPFVALLASGAHTPLSAGPFLAIDDGLVQQRIRPVEGAGGVYHTRFALPGLRGGSGVLSHFLNPAELHVSGQGGEAGQFRVSLHGPKPFDLAAAPSTVDRARGVSLRWQPLGADRFAIAVFFFVDPVTYTTGTCYCVAAPGAAGIEIPRDALAGFPAIASAYGGAQSSLTVIAWPIRPASFQAPGLQHGLAVSAYLHQLQIALR